MICTNVEIVVMKQKERLQENRVHVYGPDSSNITAQRTRFQNMTHTFRQKFGVGECHFFSTPGRTEIGGNHTDHNHGCVLAASINADSIAAARPNRKNRVTLWSDGYERAFEVDLNQLEPVSDEEGTTTALIRGIAAKFAADGYEIGGFDACMASDVLPGSGLSSSASVEVLLGTIFNTLFNNGRITVEKLAHIGQFAENHYFGKPCGLMDQLACAVGGIIAIDFINPGAPVIKKINFDFASFDYQMMIVDSGSDHADLTDDYAAIPAEMKAVAASLGAQVCREINSGQLRRQLPALREQVGDRACLRALHFLNENDRVRKQVAALENKNMSDFLSLIRLSGNSSFKWLQNINTPDNTKNQGVAMALALTEEFLSEIGDGACRVHGGGFAGTIQAFLPAGSSDDYAAFIENIFGKDACHALQIREQGTLYLGSGDVRNPFSP